MFLIPPRRLTIILGYLGRLQPYRWRWSLMVRKLSLESKPNSSKFGLMVLEPTLLFQIYKFLIVFYYFSTWWAHFLKFQMDILLTPLKFMNYDCSNYPNLPGQDVWIHHLFLKNYLYFCLFIFFLFFHLHNHNKQRCHRY